MICHDGNNIDPSANWLHSVPYVDDLTFLKYINACTGYLTRESKGKKKERKKDKKEIKGKISSLEH